MICSFRTPNPWVLVPKELRRRHTRGDRCTTREATVSLKVVEKVLGAYAQMGVPSEPASKQVCIVDATSQLPHTRSLFFSQKFFADDAREREGDVFRVLCCFCLVFFCFLLHRRSLRESRKHTEVSRSISSSSSPASLFFSSSSSLIPHTRKQTHTSKKKTLANAGKRCSISRADKFLQIQTQNQKPTHTNKKERKQ